MPINYKAKTATKNMPLSKRVTENGPLTTTM
jgi:hypothetical protein